MLKEVKNELSCIEKKISHSGKVIYKAATMTAATMMTAVMMTPVASAATTDIWSKSADIMKNVYGKIVAIDTGLAALMLTICFITFQLSKDERKQQAAKSWAFKIALSWAGINLLGFIIAYAQTTIGSGGTNITWMSSGS